MKKRTLLKMITISLLLLVISLITYGICLKIKNLEEKSNDKDLIKEEIKDNRIHDECLQKSYFDETTAQAINKLLTDYEKESIAIYFKDVKNNYTITKNENDSFYGISLIKLLDATYLIRKALTNEVNLDEKIVYQARFKSEYSLGMENYPIGAEVPIKELIKYAITYSDNTAHEMLYDYIGFSNLKSYASSLGIKLTINEREHFGYLTANYTNVMLEEAYDIISTNKEYGELLSVAMDNDYRNSLNFEDMRFIHKYGEYAPAYNDIGIYNTDYPYFISILTSYGYQDYQAKVQELSKRIYYIYAQIELLKDNYCWKVEEETKKV